jgi:hypothetical protein
LLLFLKKPDAFRNPQLWAEDGVVFLLDAHHEGLRSVFKPHANSLYLFQRVMAYVGNYVPIRYVPHFYMYTCLAATMGVVWFVASSKLGIVARVLMGIAVVATPHLGEVFLNLTNIHWILALALLVLIASDDPVSVGGKVGACIATCVLCLTGPFVLLYLPAILVRTIAVRSRYSAALLGISLLCLAFQSSHLDGNRVSGVLNAGDPNWLGIIGNRLSGQLLADNDWLSRNLNSKALALATCVLYLYLLGQALWMKSRYQVTLLLGSLAVVAATMYAFRGCPAILGSNMAGGARYFYIPLVCLVWAIILSLSGTRVWLNPAAPLLLFVCYASVSLGPCAPQPDYGWKRACRGLRGPSPVTVRIPPFWDINYVPRAAR